jgi:hypothetical protein
LLDVAELVSGEVGFVEWDCGFHGLKSCGLGGGCPLWVTRLRLRSQLKYDLGSYFNCDLGLKQLPSAESASSRATN